MRLDQGTGGTHVLAGLCLLVMVGCGGNSAQTMVSPNRSVATEEGTVAVTVTRIDSDCRQENRCAEVEAIRTLLFTGVPGSTIRRAMVANEKAALEAHAEFFRELFDEGGHEKYVTGVMRGTAAATSPDNAQVWTVVVNYEALRIALENEGIIRKFGWRQ